MIMKITVCFMQKIIIILTQFEKANLCLLFQLKIN